MTDNDLRSLQRDLLNVFIRETIEDAQMSINQGSTSGVEFLVIQIVISLARNDSLQVFSIQIGIKMRTHGTERVLYQLSMRGFQIFHFLKYHSAFCFRGKST